LITSNANNLIKMVCSLRHKKGRQEHKLYIAEGIHPVQEAIKALVEIDRFFWTSRLTLSSEGEILLQNLRKNYEGYEVSESVFAKLSETEHPQGVLVTIPIPHEPVLKLADVSLGLVVDGLQDPGNVGTIIRTASAANLDGLLFTPGACDPFQGKVVRASMGGIFYQKILESLTPEFIISEAKKAGVQIVAGDPNVRFNYFECNLLSPTLLIVGNEGRGLTPAWEDNYIKKVFIPQPGRAESLNVAVSAGILIYEAIRQRITNHL
jgi:TrmH family RNA methyltransferase